MSRKTRIPKVDRGNYDTIKLRLDLSQNEVVHLKVGFKKEYLKYYFNAQHLLIQLQPVERSFLEFLAELSDEQNRVFIDAALKQKFLGFLAHAKVRAKVLGLNGLSRIPGKLESLGLIFHEDGKRAYYRINPKYLWRGEELRRKQLIKKLIVERSQRGLPIHFLVDQPGKNLTALKEHPDKFTNDSVRKKIKVTSAEEILAAMSGI